MKVEIRNGKAYLEGYVNAVDRDSRPIPDADGSFIERIVPGAFAEALKRANDVELLVDHRRKIGSIRDGTLELTEDNIGLRAKCVVDDSEVIEKADKKLLKGWSFGFSVLKQRAENLENGMKRRIVEALDLSEVSIIDDKMIPCYVGTSIEKRAEGEVKKEIRGVFDDLEYKQENTILKENISNAKNLDNLKRKKEYLKFKGTL